MGGMGAGAPQILGKYFSGKYHEKLGHFGQISSKIPAFFIL